MPPMSLLPLAWTLLTLATTALLVADLRRLAADGDDAPPPTPQQVRAHLWWGLLYVNPKDPRGQVPRTSGVGTTVNFRTPRNAARFLAEVGLALACAVGLVVSVLG